MSSTSSPAKATRARRKAPRYGQFFYVAVRQLDGWKCPGDPYGSASDARVYGGGKFSVQRRRFVPAKSARRFQYTYAGWHPTEDRRPESLIDFPRDWDLGCTHYEDPGEPYIRRGAFSEAAEINRECLRENDLSRWAIVYEIGEPLEYPSTEAWVHENGVGHQTQTIVRPIRLVVPSAVELVRHGDSDFVALQTKPEALSVVEGGSA